MTEEQRAADYRAQQTRRARAEAARLRALHGSNAARRALLAKWQPIIDYLEERRDDRQEADQ